MLKKVMVVKIDRSYEWALESKHKLNKDEIYLDCTSGYWAKPTNGYDYVVAMLNEQVVAVYKPKSGNFDTKQYTLEEVNVGKGPRRIYNGDGRLTNKFGFTNLVPLENGKLITQIVTHVMKKRKGNGRKKGFCFPRNSYGSQPLVEVDIK